MKTSEFKRKIEAFGLKVDEYENALQVSDSFGVRYASINRMYSESLSLNTGRLYLIKLCLEYAETPINEREYEKKYIVILPDPRNDGTHCQALFKGLYGICIGYVYRHDLQGFTESEIKRNHEYLWQFAKEVHE